MAYFMGKSQEIFRDKIGMIKIWELQNAIIDTVELYCRDNNDYYRLNHISDAEFKELNAFLQSWLTKNGLEFTA